MQEMQAGAAVFAALVTRRNQVGNAPHVVDVYMCDHQHRLPVWQGKLVARAGDAGFGTVVRDGKGRGMEAPIYIKLGSSLYAVSVRSYKY